MEKIDVFAHVLPERYLAALDKHLERTMAADRLRYYREGVFNFDAAISDLDARRRAIDRFEDYRQVLVLAVPPLEEIGPPDVAADFARRANDEMAELVLKHQDRFAGFAAALPLNGTDESIAELDRAIRHLGALGGLLYTNVRGVPLDDPRFEPLLQAFEAAGVAAWLHPTRDASSPDYATEASSDYGLWWSLGWPYETAAALSRLVYSGAMERHPGLRVIAHHGAGMVPHFSARLGMGPGFRQVKDALPRPPLEYFRRLYADTALFGAPHAVRCVIEFFGPDNVLFGTDMPLGPPDAIALTIADVEAAGEGGGNVFAANARRVLGL
jgi:aminocarboxymuconate-semialdehyde decarboxylase